MLLSRWFALRIRQWKINNAARRRVQRRRPRTILSVQRMEDRTVPSLGTVSLGTGFPGLNFNQSSGGYVPPDTIAAVGPTYVVETVNLSLAYFNKATGQIVGPTTNTFRSLKSFFAAVGASSNLSDPVVEYDESVGRFFIGVLDFGKNTFDFAISKDSNPLDGFTKFKISTKESGLFADYPRLGWNGDAYVVTFNMFNQAGYFFHPQIVAINKAKLLNGTLSGFRMDASSNDFTLTPAIMHPSSTTPSPSGTMYFTEGDTNVYYGQNVNDIKVVKMNYTWAPSAKLTYYTVTGVNTYGLPPAAQQPNGSYIDTNDSRILTAAWRDNLLVASQTVGEPGNNYAHARWYELSTASPAPSLVYQGDVGAANANSFFPAIDIAKSDMLGMTYMEVSPSEYSSVYVTSQTQGNLGTGMLPPVLAQAGTANYKDFTTAYGYGTATTPFRAGDYSSVAVDPVDDSFWAANEYASAALSSNGNWSTWIQNFTDPPADGAGSPVPTVVTNSTTLTTPPGHPWRNSAIPPPDHPLRLGQRPGDEGGDRANQVDRLFAALGQSNWGVRPLKT